MYVCVETVFPVLTFDKSYQVGQEISEFEYENLDVKLRNHFAPVGEPPIEPTDASEGLEGTPDPVVESVPNGVVDGSELPLGGELNENTSVAE